MEQIEEESEQDLKAKCEDSIDSCMQVSVPQSYKLLEDTDCSNNWRDLN